MNAVSGTSAGRSPTASGLPVENEPRIAGIQQGDVTQRRDQFKIEALGTRGLTAFRQLGDLVVDTFQARSIVRNLTRTDKQQTQF